MRTRRTWITRAVLVVMLLLALTTSVFASNPTDEPGSKMIECPDCGTSTACMVCYGLDPQCESCGGTNVCATCGGTGYVQSPSSFYNTAFSLLPPVIAIALALITKEVYSSLFIGILVGSVMRPITDRHHVSRAKLAYIIDATAAPVCIIAPISSWAAAVSAFAEDGQGLTLFIRAIPYNFYALLTIVMMLGLVLMKVDFGPMAKFERNAIENNDLFSGSNPYAMLDEEIDDTKGTVMDLVLPIAVLVVCCVIGMIYSGGFFSGTDFVSAFSNSDASVGLMFGSAFGLLFALIYYTVRRSMSFKEMMSCVPEGFKAMVPAILILTFAWSLKSMTDSLGAKYFVRDFVYNNAESLQNFLPAIVFLIGCGLAFATGTSWGTFGILIPIVQNVFPLDNPLGIICISACMAGAVCGDHCSPISDTTIMASAGAQCDHVNHVSTQLPYAISCAVISFVTYIVAGFVQTPFIALPVGIVLMLAFLFIMKQLSPGQSHRAA